MRVMLITPLYPPLRGGAATYTSMITHYFQDIEEVESLFVLTEYVKNSPLVEREGRVTVMRYLAPRACRPILNPVALWLTGLVSLWQVIALVHWLRVDWIHWHNSAIIRAREIFSRRFKLRPVLLDVRDSLSPASRVEGCQHYIASSRNILEYILQSGIPADMVTSIPIPFEMPTSLSETEVEAVLRRYDIERKKTYVLFVGDLSQQKGVLELLEGFRLFTNCSTEKLKLIFVGADRSGGRFTSLIGGSEVAIYLGKLPRNDVLALMRGAKCVVLPAKGEALPRVILEAIALGTPVVCSPDVPEFAEYCPDFVLDEISPQAIAAKLAEVIRGGKVTSYPFELHNPRKSMDRLLATYRQMRAVVVSR